MVTDSSDEESPPNPGVAAAPAAGDAAAGDGTATTGVS